MIKQHEILLVSVHAQHVSVFLMARFLNQKTVGISKINQRDFR